MAKTSLPVGQAKPKTVTKSPQQFVKDMTSQMVKQSGTMHFTPDGKPHHFETTQYPDNGGPPKTVKIPMNQKGK